MTTSYQRVVGVMRAPGGALLPAPPVFHSAFVVVLLLCFARRSIVSVCDADVLACVETHAGGGCGARVGPLQAAHLLAVSLHVSSWAAAVTLTAFFVVSLL